MEHVLTVQDVVLGFGLLTGIVGVIIVVCVVLSALAAQFKD